MSIIDPSSGRPISSKRKVSIQIRLIDQQAMSSQPKIHELGFVLDRSDRIYVSQFLTTLTRGILAKLEEIKFFAPAPPAPTPQADGHS
jgi:hypothetical protein